MPGGGARSARELWNVEAACLGAALGSRVKWWDAAPHEAVARLRALAPPYRVDHLLELGAELHHALAAYRQAGRAGRVGPDTVREAALAVAAEAALVFLVETEQDEQEDVRP
jgi:hypothetical protein